MALAVMLLSSLFESHIYIVSSVFFGFVLGAVPLIVEEELDCLRKRQQSFVFSLLGVAVVAGITWMNKKTGASMELAQFSIGMALRLFLIGMAAIFLFNFLGKSPYIWRCKTLQQTTNLQ